MVQFDEFTYSFSSEIICLTIWFTWFLIFMIVLQIIISFSTSLNRDSNSQVSKKEENSKAFILWKRLKTDIVHLELGG